MNPNDPNVVLLDMVAGQLGGDLCRQMVFVGGAVAGLLVTDPAMPAIRATEDVDVVCEVLTLTDYRAVEDALRARGFMQDTRLEAPICRWRVAGITVDVMPSTEAIFGFTNRWYPLALQTAKPTVLPSGHEIRVITAPVFLATKLEAFKGRGLGDFLFSHDMGDLVSVLDGREAILQECKDSALELRVYLCRCFAEWIATPAFLQSLSGHLPPDAASQERLPDLLQKLQMLASMENTTQ